MTSTSTLRHVGKPYLGLTNRELAAGKGLFVSDIVLPGMAHLAVLRSPHAAARIVSIDTSAAEELDGVVYVMTGDEAKAEMRRSPKRGTPRRSAPRASTGTR